LLDAKDNKLSLRQFDKEGNIAFGIHEYIDVPGVKYDPKVGIMGFEVCVTFKRAGFRIRRRRIMMRKISLKHRIKKEEVIEFMEKKFNVRIGEE